MKPTLSIIIVSFNTKTLTLDTIKSVHLNKVKISCEILVIDNGSTDGSVEALLKIKNIKLIKNKTNLGFAKANNIGIKEAKGKYILLLNSDTKVKKGSLDKLIKFAKENKNAGAVVPKLLNSDGSVQKSVFKLPSITGAIKEYWLKHTGEFEKYIPDTHDNKSVKVEAAVMAAFLITPQGFKIAKYLDERYFMYFEDLDYCRKMQNNGLDVIYLPDAEIIHYHGESGKNVTNKENQWRRLIPSSKIYHGLVNHYMINFILWTGQKWNKLLSLAR